MLASTLPKQRLEERTSRLLSTALPKSIGELRLLTASENH